MKKKYKKGRKSKKLKTKKKIKIKKGKKIKTKVKKPSKQRKNLKKSKKVIKKSLKKPTKQKKEIRVMFNEEDRKEIISLFSDAYARKVLISLGGENALEIIRTYPLEVSDEEIAKRLKVKISDIRSTLNKMHGEGFVDYTRRKDNETGWYSYSWSLNKKNIVEWAGRITREKDELLGSELEKYYCRKCGLDSMIGFVDALEKNFKCHCCNGSLEFLENEKTEQLFSKIMPDHIKRRRIM